MKLFKGIQTIGGFPFRTYESLLFEEVQFFDQLNKQKLSGLLPILELTEKVAEYKEIDTDAAYSLMMSALTGDLSQGGTLDILVKFRAELELIKESQYSEIEYQSDLLALIMNTRIPQKWYRENAEALEEEGIRLQTLFDEDGEETLHWTAKCNKRLPEGVMQEINLMIATERNGGQKPSKEEEDSTLGKSSSKSGKSSRHRSSTQ
jgi:hypothetical protein